MTLAIDVVLETFTIDPARLVAAAREAEELGYDGVWLYDHLSGDVVGEPAVVELWSTLGAVVASTEQITVGSLVTNVTLRHPAITAVAAATLQTLSGGRFVLGVGAGAGPGSTFASELTMLDFPVYRDPRRREVVRDTIEGCRRLWANAHEYTGVLLPDPAPPIIVGANGPKMAVLAGETADGVNFHSFEEDLEALVEISRRAAGRDDFIVTIEAPNTDAWLDATSEQRRQLDDLSADRLMLKTPAPYRIAT